MNSTAKRLLFWIALIIIIIGIVWGLIAAADKDGSGGSHSLSTPISSTDWTKGSSTAPVTIVEYADFQCPACQAYSPVINQLLTDEGTTTFFVYRYFPLTQHPHAIITASAAEAAGMQGKFWEMHDMLFANHSEWEDTLDPHTILIGYAKKIGLNVDQFKKDLDSDTVKARVLESLHDAQTQKLMYTPTIFINGIRVQNPQNLDAFKKLIDAAIHGTLTANS